jgi:hypothetical protein
MFPSLAKVLTGDLCRLFCKTILAFGAIFANVHLRLDWNRVNCFMGEMLEISFQVHGSCQAQTTDTG